MRKRAMLVVLPVLALLLAALACGGDSTSEGEAPAGGETPGPTDTPMAADDAAVPTGTPVPAPTNTPAPTETPATDTPEPTPTQEIEGRIEGGTHLVGTDIEPGIYVGLAGEGLFDSCYWARLSNLTGSDDILANDNAVGLYYLEVLPDDVALETACELLPIEQVPARSEFLVELPPGTYIVGRDIEAGVYVGEAGEDLFESCYWSRLSNLTGENDILANENAVGLYYVEVLGGDIALQTACELLPIEQVAARAEFLTELPPGTYIVGRDIEAGTYRGEAGDDILDACYWARLSNVSGDDDILANDNANGQYFVEVLATDFALQVACAVERAE
jgi:hypothetical protein